MVIRNRMEYVTKHICMNVVLYYMLKHFSWITTVVHGNIYKENHTTTSQLSFQAQCIDVFSWKPLIFN